MLGNVFCLRHSMSTGVILLSSDKCMNRWMAKSITLPYHRKYSVMMLNDNTMYSKANNSMVILW
jgi:hypothetical protein